MARSAIPNFGIEYPEYEHRDWPKHVGFDIGGEALTANSQEEFEALQSEAIWPKHMGKDKNGKDVIAASPTEDWKKELVVKTSVPSTDEENALQPKRGPGRPRTEQAA
jgi:hypothetical protein